ncbi:hypothetical protein CYMTET_54738 [Cymbomonas tetramitiformis]|uniref:PH domain-containing protein n=1 Tax=Cymbomonas tetramitiformis TaxID=36881 RepID=A0AAE0BG35_9CHLO|nr:hypothetical protein CYMTET_54738 [Cymbomonas tetramitiformis]
MKDLTQIELEEEDDSDQNLGEKTKDDASKLPILEMARPPALLVPHKNSDTPTSRQDKRNLPIKVQHIECGYLYLQNSGSLLCGLPLCRRWKKRWFALVDGALVHTRYEVPLTDIYTDPYWLDHQPVTVIPLAAIVSVEKLKGAKDPSNSLSVTIVKNGSMVLRADGGMSKRDEWVMALQEAVVNSSLKNVKKGKGLLTETVPSPVEHLYTKLGSMKPRRAPDAHY